MTELDLMVAVLFAVAGCLIAAGGALWIARKDNSVPHPPAGE